MNVKPTSGNSDLQCQFFFYFIHTAFVRSGSNFWLNRGKGNYHKLSSTNIYSHLSFLLIPQYRKKKKRKKEGFFQVFGEHTYWPKIEAKISFNLISINLYLDVMIKIISFITWLSQNFYPSLHTLFSPVFQYNRFFWNRIHPLKVFNLVVQPSPQSVFRNFSLFQKETSSPYESLCLFLNWVVCLSSLSCKSLLYVIDTSPLWNMWFANFSSHSVSSHFTS